MCGLLAQSSQLVNKTFFCCKVYEKISMFSLQQSGDLIYTIGKRLLKPPMYKCKEMKERKAKAFSFHLQVKSVIGSSFKPAQGE